jgi:sec-independent protein translocase protein TatA
MDIGPWEIALVIIVLVLLFGAKKLPELARGSGRALRIFKAETKGLMDDDEDDAPPARPAAPQQLTQDVAQPQPTDSGQHAAPAQPSPPTQRDS